MQLHNINNESDKPVKISSNEINLYNNNNNNLYNLNENLNDVNLFDEIGLHQNPLDNNIIRNLAFNNNINMNSIRH